MKPAEDFRSARWYTIKPAQSSKPATYTCPLCRAFLPALSAHYLVMPDGDPQRRRHAHAACVEKARTQGRLPLREDVEPRTPGPIARLRARLRR